MAYIDKTFTNIAVGSTSSATNSAYITNIKYGLCDDAARIILGNKWRIPTKAEYQELIDNCTFEAVDKDVKIISKTDPTKYVIFPYKETTGGSCFYLTDECLGDDGVRCILSEASYTGEKLVVISNFRYLGFLIKPVTENDDTHGVDLNLPSGLKWAKFNLTDSGFTNNEFESGDRYAYGEVKSKDTFTYNNYKWFSGAGPIKYGYSFNKMTLDKEPSVDKVYLGTTLLFSKVAQTKTDDAARAILGGKWRMPTVAETLTLADQCTLSGSGTATFTLTLKTTPTVGLNKLSFNVGGNGAAKNVGYWSSEKGSNDLYGLISLNSKGVAAAVNGNQRYNANRIRPVMTVTDISEVEGLSGMLITDADGNMTFWSSTDLIDPETGGAFFRWGETTGNLYQSGWTTEGYKWYDGTTYTKYNSIDGLTTLQLEYVD